LRRQVVRRVNVRNDLPVYTSHLLPLLADRPLLKTSLVDIVPASSLAPDDLFRLRLELSEADRAVTADFFAVVAGRGVCFDDGEWGVGEDLAELLLVGQYPGCKEKRGEGAMSTDEMKASWY